MNEPEWFYLSLDFVISPEVSYYARPNFFYSSGLLLQHRYDYCIKMFSMITHHLLLQFWSWQISIRSSQSAAFCSKKNISTRYLVRCTQCSKKLKLRNSAITDVYANCHLSFLFVVWSYNDKDGVHVCRITGGPWLTLMFVMRKKLC